MKKIITLITCFLLISFIVKGQSQKPSAEEYITVNSKYKELEKILTDGLKNNIVSVSDLLLQNAINRDYDKFHEFVSQKDQTLDEGKEIYKNYTSEFKNKFIKNYYQKTEGMELSKAYFSFSYIFYDDPQSINSSEMNPLKNLKVTKIMEAVVVNITLPSDTNKIVLTFILEGVVYYDGQIYFSNASVKKRY